MTKKLDYHKNKESKYLYLLFTLQNKGFPVNEIYESEVKEIPTSRFAEVQGLKEDGGETAQDSIMFSFYSDDSFEPIEPKLLAK